MPFDVTGSAGVGDDITIPSALARTWELVAGRHDVTTVLPGAGGGRDCGASQRWRVAAVPGQPDSVVEEAGGGWQFAQYRRADAGTGAGQGPRDRGRGAPQAVAATDGPGDRAELAVRQGLGNEG